MSICLQLSCGCGWGCAAWPIRTHFIQKSITFLLKVKKLVKPVIDIEREFLNFTTLIEYCKLFKISTTVIWSIAIGYSWIITVFLLICMAQAEKHWGQYVVIDVNDCKNYDSIEGRDQRPWKESNFNFNKGLKISSYNRKLSHCILSNNFTGVDKIWIGPDRNTDWITDQNKKFWKMKN